MAGIYIHVPFCKTRCIYCDFFTGTNQSYKVDYISALCKELVLRKKYLGDEPIRTIYWGGGTPSQLEQSDFEQIFEAIYKNYSIVLDAEITLEANPDDLGNTYLAMLKTLPFNRISVGIQSFNNSELHFLNRRHSAQKAIDAVKSAQKIGFKNISIDLMFGLPNQTMETWQQSVDTALSLDIQHISAYHLIYEPDTELYRLLKQQKVEEANEDLSLEMFSVLINSLKQNDFIHYEISNFAKEGLFSKHNSSYWLGEKYLGLGPSAHSFDGVDRAWNISSIKKYLAGIEVGMPSVEYEVLDMYSRYNDFILTGMRTIWGVDLIELERLFGTKMRSYCLKNVQKYIEQKLVLNVDNRLSLTSEGVFISDGIMSNLMFVE